MKYRSFCDRQTVSNASLALRDYHVETPILVRAPKLNNGEGGVMDNG